MIFMHYRLIFESEISLWRQIHVHFYQEFMFYVHTYTKIFPATVYQERLVFYYFKNNIKRYLKWDECIFSSEKSKSFWEPWTPTYLDSLHSFNFTVLCWQKWTKHFGTSPLIQSWNHPCILHMCHLIANHLTLPKTCLTLLVQPLVIPVVQQVTANILKQITLSNTQMGKGNVSSNVSMSTEICTNKNALSVDGPSPAS